MKLYNPLQFCTVIPRVHQETPIIKKFNSSLSSARLFSTPKQEAKSSLTGKKQFFKKQNSFGTHHINIIFQTTYKLANKEEKDKEEINKKKIKLYHY